MKIKSKTNTVLIMSVLILSFLGIFNASTATAALGDQFTLTVNVDGPVGCSVTQSVTQATYNYGDSIELTPVAAPGWSFSGWSGDLSGSASPATVTFTDLNLTVTATFTQDSYTLTMYTIGDGTVSPGNQTYLSGTVVTLTAINAMNYRFDGWSGDATGKLNTTITMDSNKAVTGNFTLIPIAPQPPTATSAPVETAAPNSAPTSTPEPTTTAPTATPTPAQTSMTASMSTLLTIGVAAIVLVALAIGLVSRSKKRKSE